MAKEKEQAQQAQQPASEATVPADSSAVIESPVILRAKSREELDTQFQQLKAKHDGHTLTAGAVARSKDDGTYILRVDII
jgi:predicted house-cleaning NTP pyrophosphatase (Maf/HAM1 superfamily)